MNRLFIIDLMPFLYRGHFVFLHSPRMTKSGINTSALIGLVSGLQSIFKREKPTHVVFAMDPTGPTFRHLAYPAYKAQREKMPEDIAASIGYAQEIAAAMKIPVLRQEGFEADDIMGTLAVKGAGAGFDVYMVTPDKDAAQLVRERIHLYRPGKGGSEAEVYGVKEVCEHWKLSSPAQMIDYLALAGDTADNIPGIRGVGEKTAQQLLAQFGSVEGIIAGQDQIKGKLAEKVAAGAEDAKISKFLTAIKTDVPMEVDFDSFRLGEVDREAFVAVCAKFELNRFCAQVLGGNRGEFVDSSINRSIDIESKIREFENSKNDSSCLEPRLSTIQTTPHEYTLVKTVAAAEALLAELKTAPLIAFDTETSGLDQRTCRLVGFSFATRPGRAWYVTGDLIDIFRPLFNDPGKNFVGHNVKFDCSVLRRYGIGFAKPPHDTMLAHYCIDAAKRHGMDALAEQYLNYSPIPITALIGVKERGKSQLSMESLSPEEICDYAAEDADVTFRLYEALMPEVDRLGVRKVLEEVEEPLAQILIAMEEEGVKLDTKALKDFGWELDGEILKLLQTIHQYSDPGLNVDSPRQLGELLFEKLKLDTSVTKRTISGQWSTNEEILQRLVDAHPVVPAILEYRACAKLKSTYADKLPTLIDRESRVHTTYSQSLTETGRLSSSDPNLQNIPIRTERGKMIRKAFVPRDENHVIISADYSQIELRLMAAFSKDEAMLDAFRRGEDIHRDTASRVYDCMPALVTPEMRSKCKMVNFGIIYGISSFGLSQRLKVPRREAADLIETYFRLYPRIKEFMNQAIAEAKAAGGAKTVTNRRRTLRDINSRNATARQAAERDAINTPIQGSAADLIKAAMVKVDRALRAEGLKTRMVLQIHDELVFDAPKEEAEKVCEIVRREMTGAMDFGVPLEVSVGVGPNWLAAH